MTDRFDDGRTPDQPSGNDAPTPPLGLPRQEPAAQPGEPAMAGPAPHGPTPEPTVPLPGQPATPGGPQPPADQNATDQPASGEPAVPEPARRRGQMRYQDPATARPRPPTLAEQRARQRAEREAQEIELAETAEAERKRKLRRRLLVGSGVTVGVVALVSIWYAASRPREVTAYCVTDQDVVTDDSYCDDGYVRTSGGYYGGGFWYFGGRQYHYYYGGNPTPIGQRATGGSTVKPQGATITTRSGKSIQRGGFGVRGGSSKSSGS